jgi:methylthioribose-1-phosphate isomerase
MHQRELRPVEWVDGLRLIDQRLLPARLEWLACETVDDVARAIADMAVRGAPAIGITAAYGLALAAREAEGLSGEAFRASVAAARQRLAATRPTAVNLAWALAECWAVVEAGGRFDAVLAKARALHEADVEGNRRMAATGAARLESGMGVLTHCNAGALATGGVGTALGVLAHACADGKRLHVYVDETRPRLQGARLTAWELSRLGVPYTLICDNMAASLMAKGRIHACVVGADRIAANGDTANKIGTYSVAVNAAYHRLPFYVAAPRSTFDLSLADGSAIPIEERAADEVTTVNGERLCPEGAQVANPSFDVTPAGLITALFTDVGEVAPVTGEAIVKLVRA